MLEVPDSDSGPIRTEVAFHSEQSSLSLVECWSRGGEDRLTVECGGLVHLDPTSIVTSRIVNGTVGQCCDARLGLLSWVDATLVARMQRDQIPIELSSGRFVYRLVGIFVNVNLAALRVILRIGWYHPEGRPDGTTNRDMGRIQDKHPIGIGLVRRDAYTGTTLGLDLGRIDPHDVLTIRLDGTQVGRDGLILGKVLDQTVSGIYGVG